MKLCRLVYSGLFVIEGGSGGNIDLINNLDAGKNKLGFVDGTCVKQESSLVLSQQWKRCNAILLGWILSSLSQELYVGQVYSQIVSEVLIELKETYDKMDGSVGFNLMHKINKLKQGDLSVPDYYHKSAKRTQLKRLMQFLMGLSQPIRSTILAKDPLPNVKDAFNIVSKEQSNRGIHPGVFAGNKAQHADFVVKTNNNTNNITRRVNTNNNNTNNKLPNPILLCKNYGLIGHTIERNYELIGYPVGFKRNLNLSKQSSNVKRFNANSEVNQSVPSTSGFVSASFTNEQMMKLLSIINEKPSPSAIMLGIKPSFYNNNVFFNLHFEKNFCAKSGSVMFDVTLGWIIDLGANQHITDSTKDMFNVVDISSLMLTVGRPNGTLSKINAIGSLRLTSGIVLFEVLVVAEYNVTLLSVNKMINDSKFFVGFGEHKCYIQHLKLDKLVGTVVKLVDFTCLMLIKVISSSY
ncbi:hypothetical protein Tco_0962036 [Tanacetum coccineum]